MRRSLVAVKHATTLHPPHLKEGHWPRSLLSLEKRERRRVPLSPYLLLLLNFVQRRSGYVSNSPCGRECSRRKRREHPGSTNRGVSDEPPPRTGPGGVEARAKARTGERSVPRKEEQQGYQSSWNARKGKGKGGSKGTNVRGPITFRHPTS